jgi:hypothetical protein
LRLEERKIMGSESRLWPHYLLGLCFGL